MLNEDKIVITISNNLQLICIKGMKLKVFKDCFDEYYLHELRNHWREGLKERKLKEGDIVEVVRWWRNFNGFYITCRFNNETFDVNPLNLSII